MIRHAHVDDIDRIFSIEKDSFEFPWSITQLYEGLDNKLSINWVIEREDKIIAYLFGQLILEEYHLHNIAVDKKFRKQGIAIKLMDKMLEFTKENKVKAVFLEVSSSNLPACKLYEKKGFVAQGIRKNYYPNGDDAILYTRLQS